MSEKKQPYIDLKDRLAATADGAFKTATMEMPIEGKLLSVSTTVSKVGEGLL